MLWRQKEFTMRKLGKLVLKVSLSRHLLPKTSKECSLGVKLPHIGCWVSVKVELVGDEKRQGDYRAGKSGMGGFWSIEWIYSEYWVLRFW